MDTKQNTEAEGNAPFLRFLNEDRCKKVHEATLELLERTGVWIGDPECLEMLSGAGARVVEKVAQKDSDYNTRVQIPAHLVEDAIHSAPESVTVYNRQGGGGLPWCFRKEIITSAAMATIRISSILTRISE